MRHARLCGRISRALLVFIALAHFSEYRVYGAADQKRHARQIHPKHQYDYGSERAVSFVIRIEIRKIDPESAGQHYPKDDRNNCPGTDPDPLEFLEALQPAVDDRGRENHHQKDHNPLK